MFPLRKFYTEQIFVLLRMQLRKHSDAQPVKRFKRWNAMRYVYDIKFEMLQVRQNEISLRKWSGGTAQLRTSEGALVPG